MINIPKRFEGAKYEDVPANIQALIENIAISRKGIYIYSDCGTGKTHVAYAIAKKMDEDKFKVKFYNTTNLLKYLKEDFSEQSKLLSFDNTNYGLLLSYTGLLIIDDFGTEKMSEWVEETFYSLINKRYEEVLPTIFTSNLSPDKLTEKYGDRIVSRIIGSCDVIELTGSDKRLS